MTTNTHDRSDGSLSQVQSKRSSETYRNSRTGSSTIRPGRSGRCYLGAVSGRTRCSIPECSRTQIGLGIWRELAESAEAAIRLRNYRKQRERRFADDHSSGRGSRLRPELYLRQTESPHERPRRPRTQSSSGNRRRSRAASPRDACRPVECNTLPTGHVSA